MVEKLIGWEVSTRPRPFTMLTLADRGRFVKIAGKVMMNPLVVAIALQRREGWGRDDAVMLLILGREDGCYQLMKV